jgi:poly[(R)-3-hydroxyalkanoate] polymerase subunit PhaC
MELLGQWLPHGWGPASLWHPVGNADRTNLSATLHRQFLNIFEDNRLPTQGALKALGTPVDLGAIMVSTYRVRDHLTSWKRTYRPTQLLGGDSTFALSNAGHIASLVNPRGNPKATYFTAPTDPDESPEDGWPSPVRVWRK